MPWWNPDTSSLLEVRIYQSRDHVKQVACLDQNDLKLTVSTQPCKTSVNFIEWTWISLPWKSTPLTMLLVLFLPPPSDSGHDSECPLKSDSAPTWTDSSWLSRLPKHNPSKWLLEPWRQDLNSETLLNPSNYCFLFYLLTHRWFHSLPFFPLLRWKEAGGSLSQRNWEWKMETGKIHASQGQHVSLRLKLVKSETGQMQPHVYCQKPELWVKLRMSRKEGGWGSSWPTPPSGSGDPMTGICWFDGWFCWTGFFLSSPSPFVS